MESGQKIIQTAVDHFGKVDILVNNAGIFQHSPIFEMTEKEWDMVINVHLKGTFICTRSRIIDKQGRWTPDELCEAVPAMMNKVL